MKRLFSIVGSVALGCALFALPTSASTASDSVICKDGASSPGGRGACKGHGGIDKKATNAAVSTAAAATTSKSPAAADSASGDTVTCKDGTTSKAGKGACSHHGGKAKGGHATGSAAPAKPAPATTSSAPASPSSSSSHAAPATAKGDNANAEGATAKCKDGTYSHSKKHSGSCSHHGGVAEFVDK